VARSPLIRRVARIAGIVILALAVCAAGLWLGRWQFHRHEARAAEIAAFDAASQHEPAELNDVVPPGSAELPEDARWRIVTVTGTFASPDPTWLRNRPVEGTPAVHALAWLVTDDGRALLVDGGWVDARGSARPTLPTDPLTVTVTLRTTEPDDGRRDDGATRITPEQMPDAPARAVPGYGVLSTACQDPCGPLPGLAITPLPTLSLGPHLAYAWQWWLLSIAAIGFAVVMLRRPNADGAPMALPKPQRRRSEPTDEEIEDAL
jgi:cytochrome oxidase assembly protein ShyY1